MTSRITSRITMDGRHRCLSDRARSQGDHRRLAPMAASPTADADWRGAATAHLARGGLRLTQKRASIVELLATSERPLTMPEIRDQRPDLAQSSLYRNLVVLEQAGVVRRVVTHDEFARYEL